MSYFDCNANLPILKEVLEAYENGCKIGNVSSKTKLSATGNKIIAKFKALTNEYHGGDYDTIITSGGSESNSAIIFHFLYRSILMNKQLNVISSTVEHPSITEYLLQLQQDNLANITWITPEYNGKVVISKIIAELNPNIDCVFLQSINSETGCMQDITKLYSVLKLHKIWLHVDNVQGFKKLNYPNNIGDSISISYHKIGAPLGIGALLTKEKLHPLIAGKQNNGMRGGTYNIGAITASLYVLNTYRYDLDSKLKNRFLAILSRKYRVILYPDFIKTTKINDAIPDSIILYSNNECLPHTIFFSIIKDGNALCGLQVKNYLFEKKGFTIGTGSACNNEKPSVIGSMASSNILPKLKKGFLRISFKCSTCNLDSLANEINALQH